MRRVLSTFVSVIFACAAVQSANAATDYPSRPIHFVVPFGPGGSADVQARIVGQALSKILKQPVVIENRPGAGSVVGTTFAAKSAPDGYTILMGSIPIQATTPNLYRNLPYDVTTAFIPKTVSTGLMALIVNPKVPATDVRSFVALAKAKPNTLNFSSPGVGSQHHLAVELFKVKSQTQMVHIPFNSGLESLNAVIAGTTQFTIAQLTTALTQAEAGRVRILGVSGTERSPRAPEVPTIVEGGVPDYSATDWYSVLIPSGTPADIVATLDKALTQALNDPTVKTQMDTLGFDVVPNSTTEESAAFAKAELKKWGEIIKAANIAPR